MSVKISELPNNITYTGSEKIPLVQDTITRAGTLSSLVTYLSTFYFDPIVSELSGNWNEAYEIVTANESSWNAAYSLVSFSPLWNSTYSTVTAKSAIWDQTYNTVTDYSGNWNTAYTLVGLSPNWDSTYTIVRGNSANWNTVYNNIGSYALITNVLSLTGGTITGNLNVTGSLTANAITAQTTTYSTTTALSVITTGTTSTALVVANDGQGTLAQFYDLDTDTNLLYIGGLDQTYPNVGIRTNTPNKEFTVAGQISASNIIWDASGNSSEWNSVYASVCALSSGWFNKSSLTSYLSSNTVTISSITILDSLSAATYANNPSGKYIVVDSITGTDSRTDISQYDLFKPFATLSGAVAASTSGDTVYVRPGSYTIESGISLNGKGNIYIDLGASITVSTGVSAFQFTSNNASMNIHGHGDFTVEGTGTLLYVPLGNTNTAVSLECNSIKSPTGTGNLITAGAGKLTLDIKLVNAPSATLLELINNGVVYARIPQVYCGRYLIASGSGDTQIYSNSCEVQTSNSTSGISLSTIGVACFDIDRYTHAGIGLECSWTQNVLTEKISFKNTLWNSTANLPHITTYTTAGSLDTKLINLLGSNTMRGITTSTNSISSSHPLDVYVQNSYAVTAPSSNITFKVGSFTVDANTNNF